MRSRTRGNPQYVDLPLTGWPGDPRRWEMALHWPRLRILLGMWVLAATLLILAVWGGRA